MKRYNTKNGFWKFTDAYDSKHYFFADYTRMMEGRYGTHHWKNGQRYLAMKVGQKIRVEVSEGFGTDLYIVERLR